MVPVRFSRPLLAVLALGTLVGCPAITQAELDARMDGDRDGHRSAQFEGDDCNDDDSTVYPGAPDAAYDGLDSDCSGGSDFDADGDGYDAELVNGEPGSGDDCDDDDAAVHPGGTEVCNGIDDDCDGVVGDPGSESADESDADGDGALVCAGDCDDSDADVNPGAEERCDAENDDEDCDGATDDGDPTATGQTAWYLDSDHDGYGTPDTVSQECDAPTDYVDNADDCDDHDADVNPATVWYPDLDGDGWGDDAAEPSPACEQPDGFVVANGDCNDADAGVNPDAQEVPYDGTDGDCSGGSDDDADGDGHDIVGAEGGDDCDDTNAGVHPGAVEICDGLDGDCNGVIGDPTDSATDESDYDADGFLVCEGDCDDTDAGANPGASEICDPLNTDEDCDGSTDDGDGSATGQASWYRDSDADGYGTADTVSSQCDQPAGFVANVGDCDDSDDGINPDTLWYADADGDDFGDAGSALVSCAEPTGYVLDATDCDDSADAVHPGALEACNSLDDDCDDLVDAADPDVDPSEAVWYRDRDADSYGDASASTVTCTTSGGYSHASGDCDDFAASIHPGATEVCDTDDNDCDGSIDDADPDVSNLSTFYADADRDGFGDSSDTRIACFAPDGRVADATDCDDDDSAIHPSAQEVCDAIDNDCDADVDDADATVAPGATSYTDRDLDGYGDSATSTTLCLPPSGNVDLGGDCDDTLDSAWPGAPEIWYDGVDQDCAGDDDFDQDGDGDDAEGYDADGHPGADCDDTDGTIASFLDETWYDGIDQDCAGDDDYDRDADGWASDVYGGEDCDDGEPGVSPGELEDCGTVGVDDDCTGSVNDVDALGCSEFHGDADEDGFGFGVGSCQCSADLDFPSSRDDDCDDLDDEVSPGVNEVCRDGIDNDCDEDDLDCILTDRSVNDADAHYTGESFGDYAGYNVAGAGDLNDDGFDDLLLGGNYNDACGTDAGAAYVVFGSASPVSESLAAADVKLCGAEGARAGYSLASAGDVDGDGVGDALIGAPGGSTAVHLILGTASLSSGSLATADSTYTAGVGDSLGIDISGGFDVDGDGFDDSLLTVGNYYDSYIGSAYLVLGAAPPATGNLSGFGVLYDGFGSRPEAALAGDIDGDGLADLVFGDASVNTTGAYAGAGYLFLGSTTRAGRSVSGADATFTGGAAYDYAGGSASGAGDVNADGYVDLLVGGYQVDDGALDAGAAYLILGASTVASRSLRSADAEYTGAAISAYAGWASTGVGDLDADGFADIAVNALYVDASAGAAYVVLGSPSPVSMSLADADAKISGNATLDYAGRSLSGAGDFNSDGFDDLLIGSATNGGYLILGTGL